MTDMIDGWDVYPPDDPRNPFFGLFGFDEFSEEPDPHEKIERTVLDTLGIVDFGGLIATIGEVAGDTVRGNRFGDVREAILYLSDAGVLAFGQVVIFDNGEIGVSIGGSP